MSLALYRKYRPATFAEVIGQDHVTEPLSQALRSGRVHHAYLFAGPRGCGKTSCARILARSLNCEQGPTPTPCGVCDSCVALAPGGPGSLDVIEIDAASHGGVDEARDLRERAFYAPVSSRYKVYVVDEAHMVSREGFNALLKLVEEPPPHLKFVFATTEPERVIATIRSRTHTYPFRLVPPTVLREHLAGICALEGAEVDPLVLPLVVRAGAGSVRDAMSVLDQLIAGAGPGGVSYAGALALLGYTDAALLDEIADAVAVRDGAAVFQAVDRLVEAGHDPRRFAADLLERFRDLLILEAVPDAGGTGLLDVPADRLERLRGQAAAFGRADLSRCADLLAAGLTEMRGTTSPRLVLELVCARLLLPGAAEDSTALRVRLDRLERRLAVGGATLTAPVAVPAPPHRGAPAAQPAPGAATKEPAAPPAAALPPAAATAPTGAPPPAAPAPTAAPGPTAATAPTSAPPSAVTAPAAAPPTAATAPTSAPVDATPAVGTLHPAEDAAQLQAHPPDPVDEGAAAVRRLWPDVLQAVGVRKRTPYALLATHTQLVAVNGKVLTLAFATGGLRSRFLTGVNVEVLTEALREVLGGDWTVDAVVAGEPGGAPAPPALDEAEPGSDAVITGSDNAVDLLRRGLGAQVIEES